MSQGNGRIMEKYAALRRWSVRAGLSLLAFTLVALALVGVGLVPEEALALGPQSGFRTLAECAIVGCLLAAVGYWNE